MSEAKTTIRTAQEIRGLTTPSPPENLPATIGHNSMAMDEDMLRVISVRDEALVADEIMSGSSGAFSYSFRMPGQSKPVTGISVVGARHLAVKYKFLQHRLVCSISKRDRMMTVTTYPHRGQPMKVEVHVLDELATVDDYYTVMIEMKDLQTGLVQQTEKTEARFKKRNTKNEDSSKSEATNSKGGKPGYFENEHFETIAQAKAFRNGVIHILPQDVVQDFLAQSINAGSNQDLTQDYLEHARRGLLEFCTLKGIRAKKAAIWRLDLAQIETLRKARADGIERLRNALAALGCVEGTVMREVPMDAEVVDLAAAREAHEHPPTEPPPESPTSVESPAAPPVVEPTAPPADLAESLKMPPLPKPAPRRRAPSQDNGPPEIPPYEDEVGQGTGRNRRGETGQSRGKPVIKNAEPADLWNWARR